MANIAYFEIPSENIARAKKFYSKVFGWKINKTPMPNMPEYSSIVTGKSESKKGMSTLNMGGMMKRMYPEQGITSYVEVASVVNTLGLAKKQGGKKMGETMVIPKVGTIAFMTDSEGNTLGIWEPEKKK